MVNRRARWGVLIIAALVFGIAYAGGALSGSDPPPVSVLSTALVAAPPGPIDVTPAVAETTTTVPRSSTSITAPAGELPTPNLLSSTTSQPPPATTTTPVPLTTTTSTTTAVPSTTTTTATTTTTTVATTTTIITIPPVVGTVHIHDLKGDAKRGADGWHAKIEVQVRNDEDRSQRGVVVTGRFSGGFSELVTGSTNNKGKVIFESGAVTGDTVTFTLIDLVHPDYRYAPDENRREPTVTVEFS